MIEKTFTETPEVIGLRAAINESDAKLTELKKQRDAIADQIIRLASDRGRNVDLLEKLTDTRPKCDACGKRTLDADNVLFGVSFCVECAKKLKRRPSAKVVAYIDDAHRLMEAAL